MFPLLFFKNIKMVNAFRLNANDGCQVIFQFNIDLYIINTPQVCKTIHISKIYQNDSNMRDFRSNNWLPV